MPAIETLLTGPVAATEPAGTPPETTSGGADDFEQAMQQALAPGEKKLPEKTAVPPTGRSLPPAPAAAETLPAELLPVKNPDGQSAPSAEENGLEEIPRDVEQAEEGSDQILRLLEPPEPRLHPVHERAREEESEGVNHDGNSKWDRRPRRSLV